MTRRTWAFLVALVAAVMLAVFMPCVLTGDCGSTTQPTPQAVTSAETSTSKAPYASPTAPLPSVDPVSGLPWVGLSELPAEASDTMADIRAGGPFRFAKDGTTFGNAERLLPDQPRGHYAEFTVVTPGESTRGARRIVTGGPEYGTVNGEFYYTEDHYQSFERIRS